LLPIPGHCQDKPYIVLICPYTGTVNEPFTASVYILPPPRTAISVTISSDTPATHFSQSQFTIKGSVKKYFTVTAKNVPRSGLLFVYANADGFDETAQDVDLGFDGHLKSSWSHPLIPEEPRTMSLEIDDKEGKPISVTGDLEVKLDSADGFFVGNKDPHSLALSIPSGSRATPQFQIQPMSLRGGDVYLSAVLTTPSSHVLAQDQFSFPVKPVWWLPILLALLGGSLHAIYKIVRVPDDQTITSRGYVIISTTSLLGGFIGYLFTDFDLLGLKLDPNVLRTYVIVGFLFSYLGIEGLLSNKLPTAKKP
jgi:hypothetical protein